MLGAGRLASLGSSSQDRKYPRNDPYYNSVLRYLPVLSTQLAHPSRQKSTNRSSTPFLNSHEPRELFPVGVGNGTAPETRPRSSNSACTDSLTDAASFTLLALDLTAAYDSFGGAAFFPAADTSTLRSTARFCFSRSRLSFRCAQRRRNLSTAASDSERR